MFMEREQSGDHDEDANQEQSEPELSADDPGEIRTQTVLGGGGPRRPEGDNRELNENG